MNVVIAVVPSARDDLCCGIVPALVVCFGFVPARVLCLATVQLCLQGDGGFHGICQLGARAGQLPLQLLQLIGIRTPLWRGMHGNTAAAAHWRGCTRSVRSTQPGLGVVERSTTFPCRALWFSGETTL